MYSTARPGQSAFTLIGIVLAIFVLTLAISPDVHARDRSPLSKIERDRVIDAGVESLRASRVIARKVNRSDRRRNLLLVERRPGEKGQSTRRANVFIYDYDVDKLIHLVVNAKSGKVVHRSALTDVQLPLIDEEIQVATNIVFSNPSSRARLEEEFLRTTGTELANISQIHFKAFSFTADAVRSDAGSNGVARCGRSRCTQILMYTADKVVLDVSPIVNLSNNTVLAVTSGGMGLDGQIR